MGVRGLDTFICKNVPDGHFGINVEEEIKKYFEAAATSNPPAPIIVIDVLSMNTPISHHDKKGLFFGGRFNLAYAVIDEFLKKLKGLRAELVFFQDGPVQRSKSETWCGRQDDKYSKMVQLIEAVDRREGIEQLMNQNLAPLNFRYALRHIAKKYGDYRVSIARECDQELAAYATKVNALAIIADDSDFLIYEGSWKYWSSRQLELSTLSTMEYNRAALVSHLELSRNKMPLFATLSGNDIMPFEVVVKLHDQLRRPKFPSLARSIRGLPDVPLTETGIVNIVRDITGDRTVDARSDLVKRFQLSLDTYSVNINPWNENPTEDPVIAVLLKQDSAFAYRIWQGKTLNVSIGVVDMRATSDFGRYYAHLQISLITRMAGIILFHRKPERPTISITIKISDEIPHKEHSFLVEYPPRKIEPPTLPELLSKDPVIHENLQNVKFQLLSWIASDTLSPEKLQRVPQQLRMTVFTLYYLLEKKVLELFEADLFLKVAYDVAYETYDFRAVEYPRTIRSRPFQLSFLYQKIYAFTAKAFQLVGLANKGNFREDPPFDGVLFHQRYDEWNSGHSNLEHIKEWRIYERVKIHPSQLWCLPL